jgi:hypothetical protein
VRRPPSDVGDAFKRLPKDWGHWRRLEPSSFRPNSASELTTSFLWLSAILRSGSSRLLVQPLRFCRPVAEDCEMIRGLVCAHLADAAAVYIALSVALERFNFGRLPWS